MVWDHVSCRSAFLNMIPLISLYHHHWAFYGCLAYKIPLDNYQGKDVSVTALSLWNQLRGELCALQDHPTFFRAYKATLFCAGFD